MANSKRINSSELSDYILCKLSNVSHLKLQKLLYYVEAWHLTVLQESLIDEKFEAWLHGPVIRSVFARFRREGYLMYDHLPFDKARAGEVKESIESKLAHNQIELIEDVLSEYGDKTDYHLECLTHSEEPWIEARIGVGSGESSRNIISDETMKRYYSKLMAN